MPFNAHRSRPLSPAPVLTPPAKPTLTGSRPRPIALRAAPPPAPGSALPADALETAVAAASAMPALLKPKEVAELLAVSERTLERWRITGEGPRFVRLGSKVVRYTGEEVETFVAARVKANTGQ